MHMSFNNQMLLLSKETMFLLMFIVKVYLQHNLGSFNKSKPIILLEWNWSRWRLLPWSTTLLPFLLYSILKLPRELRLTPKKISMLHLIYLNRKPRINSVQINYKCSVNNSCSDHLSTHRIYKLNQMTLILIIFARRKRGSLINKTFSNDSHISK